jgi:hypothetical protein
MSDSDFNFLSFNWLHLVLLILTDILFIYINSLISYFLLSHFLMLIVMQPHLLLLLPYFYLFITYSFLLSHLFFFLTHVLAAFCHTYSLLQFIISFLVILQSYLIIFMMQFGFQSQYVTPFEDLSHHLKTCWLTNISHLLVRPSPTKNPSLNI